MALAASPNLSTTRALQVRPGMAAASGEIQLSSIDNNPPSTKLTSADLGRDDLSGLTLGPYVLGCRIGHGGMGQVVEATHTTLGKKFAIKLMLADVAHNTDGERRFLDEIASLGKLQHPNVLNASDAGHLDGVHYLVTEFLDGMNLTQLVTSGGPLSIERAVNVTCQVAKGLAYAHSLGFIHRDVKPSNIILDEYGVARLLDFGLARNSDGTDGITAAGQLLGTIDYLAPEQAADGRLADNRSDLYSLGCTLLFLLTGKPPFIGEQYVSLTSRIHGHLFLRPAALDELSSILPQHVRNCLESLLAKSPADRPSSAIEVVQQLQGATTNSPTTANAGPSRAGCDNQNDVVPVPSGRLMSNWSLGNLTAATFLAATVLGLVAYGGGLNPMSAGLPQSTAKLTSPSSIELSSADRKPSSDQPTHASSNETAKPSSIGPAHPAEPTQDTEAASLDGDGSESVSSILPEVGRTIEVSKSLSSSNVGLGRTQKPGKTGFEPTSEPQHRAGSSAQGKTQE